MSLETLEKKGADMSRVLLVDEQPLVRVAIKRLLQDEGGTELVAECSSGREAIEQLRHCRPEMVIMDMGIEVLGVFDIVRHMRTIDPQPGIIILTTTLDASFPRRIIKLGVSACLSKSCSAHEFYKAIRAVQAGRHYIPEAV
ncbi:response regulator transcription factor [Sulfuriflexus sp.]|uniref:response regulator n=1 Tax=Sulfuriflexus sp. TaxID=2015443 RepID=UPI0028CCE70D|nr:response regulator transcription factor [Sulfuriflexus sp.]MDT8403161.1 response regulator transcription factor [Sulfuriflexus sp.]